MKFYILTSNNYKGLMRHFDPEYSHIQKEDAVVIINSLDGAYIEQAKNFCIVKDIKYYITESNGSPAKGKNSLLDIFLESNNDYCVMIDGDDFLTPHGVWMYKHLAGLETPPDAVCLINQTSLRYQNDVLYSVNPFTVDYEDLLSSDYYTMFKHDLGLSHEKSMYFHTLHNKYYAEQQKYSEGSEVHCRVTWMSKKAAQFKFDEDLIVGEDTLQMLRLKHEALEGRLNLYTTNENPATYVYDEREPGTVMLESSFGTDYEWMDVYLNALEEMKENNQLHLNTCLPELKIEYPQDYVYNDLELTEPHVHELQEAHLVFPQNATDNSIQKCYEFLKSLDNKKAA